MGRNIPAANLILLILGCLFLVLAACGCAGTQLTKREQAALLEILPETADLTDITEEVMTPQRIKKFPAVKKVYRVSGEYFAFVVKPVGYNGPIDIVLTIGIKEEKTGGLRIVKHLETEHYVRDMESPWFVDRFSGKNIFVNLVTVKLEALAENEIVAITGSTVTTDAVVNGVNAAFAVFREYILGEELPAVPLEVEGFIRGS